MPLDEARAWLTGSGAAPELVEPASV